MRINALRYTITQFVPKGLILKIRSRAVFNNLLIGILPLLLVSIIFLITRYDEFSRYYLHNMDVSLNNFKLFLEEDLEKYRYHALFIAQENTQPGYDTKLQLDMEGIFSVRPRLRIIEIFRKDKKELQEMALWRDYMYTVSPRESQLMWQFFSQNEFKRKDTLSIPRLISNTLVFRNCALLYSQDKYRKAGFVSISLPLDLNYFREFAFQEVGVVFFILTPGGILFSDPDFQNDKISARVLQSLAQHQEIPRLDLGDKGSFFLHYTPYIPVAPLVSNGQAEPMTYIGMLYAENKLNQPFRSFQQIYRITLIVSLLLLAFTAAWFSSSLTRPLRRLKEYVRKFEKNLEQVPLPEKDVDEITELQGSIARMSQKILINQSIMAKERDHLRHKQEIQLNELEMARNIQSRLLPPDSPHPGITFYFNPMEEVSGDYYDFLPLGPQRMGVFLSDVSGHGIPAAFITAMLKSFTLQNQALADQPALFMKQLNHFLLNHIGENFVTALYGVMDFEKNRFVYCNAGHFEPLVIDGDRIYSPYHQEKSPCLGVFEPEDVADRGLSFTEQILDLPSQSRILMYTDGLIETVRYQAQSRTEQTREEFGEFHLMACLYEYQDSPDKPFISFLVERLNTYRQFYEFDDDICIISLQLP